MRKILSIFFLSLFIFSFLKKEALATEGTLACQPTTGTYKVGDTITVSLILDTRSFQAFGADAVATYTTTVIEPLDSQVNPSTSGTGWTSPVTNTIDTSLGKIELDYGNGQNAYTGSTTIGQLNFKAKAAGQAQFVFTFLQPYDDTTPGVAKVWGKRDGVNLSNVLTDVTNCIYVVEGEAPTSTPVPVNPSPTSVAPTSPLPQSTVVPTAAVSQLPRSGEGKTFSSFLLLSVVFLGLGGFLFPAFSFRQKEK